MLHSSLPGSQHRQVLHLCDRAVLHVGAVQRVNALALVRGVPMQSLVIRGRPRSRRRPCGRHRACRVCCRAQGLQGPEATLACGSVPIHVFAAQHHEPQVDTLPRVCCVCPALLCIAAPPARYSERILYVADSAP